MKSLCKVDQGNPISVDDLRARVFEFEREQLKKPQVALRVVIHRAPGIHARELHIPAGMDITGRVHKYENLNILSQGEMLVTTENGIEHVKAPFTCVSPAGTKRAATTLTDCVWTTVLGTDEIDPDKVEELFTTNDEIGYLAFVESLKIEGVI